MSAATRARSKMRAKAAAKAKSANRNAKPVASKAAAESRRPAVKPAACRKPAPKPAAPVPTSSAPAMQEVTFTFRAERGSEVFVAGAFNDWEPTRTRLAWESGAYAVTVRLAKGRYEYKFVVNGTWCMDPECPDWVPNGFGSLNSVITVE